MTIFLALMGLYIAAGIYEHQKHDISSKHFGINENGWYMVIPDFEKTDRENM